MITYNCQIWWANRYVTVPLPNTWLSENGNRVGRSPKKRDRKKKHETKKTSEMQENHWKNTCFSRRKNYMTFFTHRTHRCHWGFTHLSKSWPRDPRICAAPNLIQVTCHVSGEFHHSISMCISYHSMYYNIYIYVIYVHILYRLRIHTYYIYIYACIL